MSHTLWGSHFWAPPVRHSRRGFSGAQPRPRSQPPSTYMLRLRPDLRPPFCPALDAKSRCLENDRLSAGILFPPMLAISRRLSGDIDAKPRLLFALWIIASVIDHPPAAY